MPSTLGHSLAGVLVNESRLFMLGKSHAQCVVIALVLANFADIDIIPGLFYGNPNRFHHGVTHSFGAALIVGFLFALIFYKWQTRFWSPFGFATLVYSSHLLLDILTIDTSYPFGVPLWWPVSSKYFIAPITIFSDVNKDSATATFFQSLFTTHNLFAALLEIVILGPIVLLTILMRKLIAK